MNLLPKTAYESPRIGNEAALETGMEMKKSQSAVEPSNLGVEMLPSRKTGSIFTYHSLSSFLCALVQTYVQGSTSNVTLLSGHFA